VKEYHEVHPEGDKRTRAKTKVASTLPHYPHPVWLLDSDLLSTFNSMEAATTALAAAAAATANSSTAGLSALE
jgi:hypothetical protein